MSRYCAGVFQFSSCHSSGSSRGNSFPSRRLTIHGAIASSIRSERSRNQAESVPSFRPGAEGNPDLPAPAEADDASLEKGHREENRGRSGWEVYDTRRVGSASPPWLVGRDTRPFSLHQRSSFSLVLVIAAKDGCWTGLVNWRQTRSLYRISGQSTHPDGRYSISWQMGSSSISGWITLSGRSSSRRLIMSTEIYLRIAACLEATSAGVFQFSSCQRSAPGSGTLTSSFCAIKASAKVCSE